MWSRNGSRPRLRNLGRLWRRYLTAGTSTSVTVTLRPNALLDQDGGWTTVGATTEWEALADDSDATYIQTSIHGSDIRVHFETVNIGTGTVLKVTARARWSSNPGGDILYLWYQAAGILESDATGNSTPHNFSLTPHTGNKTQTEINDLVIQTSFDAGGGVPLGRVYALYVDVEYIP